MACDRVNATYNMTGFAHGMICWYSIGKIASELSRFWLRSIPSYEHVEFLSKFVWFYLIL